MSQSNNLSWNDSMDLFHWGWSCLMNKLFLIRSLNLFASEARISKWSYSNIWSDTADCLTLLDIFQPNYVLWSSSKKVVVCFTRISNPEIITRIIINNDGADLFLKGFNRTLRITIISKNSLPLINLLMEKFKVCIKFK